MPNRTLPLTKTSYKANTVVIMLFLTRTTTKVAYTNTLTATTESTKLKAKKKMNCAKNPKKKPHK